MVAFRNRRNRLNSVRSAAAIVESNSRELQDRMVSLSGILTRVSDMTKSMGKAKARTASVSVAAKAHQTRRLLAQAITELRQTRLDLEAIGDSATHIYKITDMEIAEQPAEKPKLSGLTCLHKGSAAPSGLPDSNSIFLLTPGCILQSRR